jgi:hypothetical protein
MLSRPNRQLDVLSVSALDLFASALGVFVLIAVLLFPYYLKQPSQQDDLEGAQADLSALGESYERARRSAAEAAEARTAAEARLRQARAALEEARIAASQAGQDRELAQQSAEAAAAKKASRESQPDTNFAMADLDLVFVMDATGSMDDEIRDVQANLLGLVRILERLAPSLHVGFVAYKDRGDEYLARDFPLTPMRGANLGRIQSFVESLEAGGGGDVPEPVAHALQIATAMNWRPRAEGLIVVIGDAASHQPDWGTAFGSASAFAGSAPDPEFRRRVSAIFTGGRSEGRDFFRRLAESGGGDIVMHRGRMMESVLLSVLDETVRWKRKET